MRARSLYRFISDPGHGWLEVPLSELVELGIAQEISSFSYQSKDGNLVYLEEDCDLGRFADAKGWSQKTAWENWKEVYQRHATGIKFG